MSLLLMNTKNRVPIANRLLAAVPCTKYRRLMTNMEPVLLSVSEMLYEPGEGKEIQGYFPSASCVSVKVNLEIGTEAS